MSGLAPNTDDRSSDKSTGGRAGGGVSGRTGDRAGVWTGDSEDDWVEKEIGDSTSGSAGDWLETDERVDEGTGEGANGKPGDLRRSCAGSDVEVPEDSRLAP